MVAVAFALTATLTACSGPEAGIDGNVAPFSEGAWTGTIETRDGVVYVTNPSDGLWAARDPFPVRWELEQVFGVEAGDDDATLGVVSDLVVDDSGNVYVFDGQRDRLIAFDIAGGVRWAVGRQGQGPRDFDRVRGLAWDGGSSIYVANLDSSRLDRWDTSGTYIGSRPLADIATGRPELVGWLAPDKAVLIENRGREISSFVVVVRIGEAMERVAEVAPDLFAGLDLSPPRSCVVGAVGDTSVGVARTTTCGTPVRVAGDSIFVGNHSEYALRAYAAGGALQRIVSRDVDYLLPPGSYSLQGRISLFVLYSTVEAPLRLADGQWIVPTQWLAGVDDPSEVLQHAIESDVPPPNPVMSAFDYFDREGRFLGSVLRNDENLRRIGQPEVVGPDGRIYTVVSDPFPQVRRFRIEIDR